MWSNIRKNVAAVATGTAVAIGLFTLLMGAATVWSATNSATNVGGGSHTLTASGNVTVTSTTLQLVKQVWVSVSGSWTCKASAPADASCNSSATTVNVPAGTVVKFLMFVKNSTDITLSDIRFEDLVDEAAFTYVATSMKRTQTGGSEPLSTDTAAVIFANADAGTALTDAQANADEGAMDTTTTPNDTLTIGGSGAVGQNKTLSVTNGKSFGVVFQVTKI